MEDGLAAATGAVVVVCCTVAGLSGRTTGILAACPPVISISSSVCVYRSFSFSSVCQGQGGGK